MADQNMNIVIGATVNQATQGLDNVSKGLAKTALAGAALDSKLQTASKSTNTAAFALTNLGRVAQDAPFGFIAIQNNLNPLLESFQRLKAEAGSSGAALKALGSSLIGPAGLGIALSVVSSFLVLYTQHQQQAKKQTDDFVDAIAKSQASLNTEVTKISALVQVAKDYGESQQVRKNALDELQKLYPGYLANINLENINSQEATIAIDNLTGALDRKAKAQAYTNLLNQAQEELFKKQKESLSDQVSGITVFLNALKHFGNAQSSSADLVKIATKNQKESLSDLQKKVEDYEHALSDVIQAQAKAGDFKVVDPTKADKAAKAVKDLSDSFVLINRNIENIPTKFIDQIGVETGDALGVIKATLDKTPLFYNVKFPPPKTDEIQDFIDDAGRLLTDGLRDATAAVGEGIGEALAGTKNPFASFFQVIGEGVKAMGARLIELGIAAKTVNKALASLFANPALAIGVGIGLEILGTLISKQGVKAFAQGGVVTRPTLALVGEQGPEMIRPLGQISSGGGVSLPDKIELILHGNTARRLLQRDANGNYYVN